MNRFNTRPEGAIKTSEELENALKTQPSIYNVWASNDPQIEILKTEDFEIKVEGLWITKDGQVGELANINIGKDNDWNDSYLFANYWNAYAYCERIKLANKEDKTAT